MHWNRPTPITLRGRIIIGVFCIIPIIFMCIIIIDIYLCTALLEGTDKTERVFIECFLEVSGNSIITDKTVIPDQDKTFWGRIKPNDSIFKVIRYGRFHKECAYEYRDQTVPFGNSIKFIGD
jgi:hypothetical protein